jgi:hypothetical protein
MRPSAVALVLAMGACGSDGKPEVTDVRLMGELMLHEILPPDWTHAWAVFLSPSGPVVPANAESLLTAIPEPTPAVGACEIISAETCHIQCPKDYVCEWNRCVSKRPLPFVTGGLVRVTGGRGPLSPMSLQFGDEFGVYESTPAPGPGFLYAGGEIIDIAFEGGGPMPAMNAQFESPAPLEITSPDLGALYLPSSGPLHVAWKPLHRTALVLIVSASSNTTGDTRIVRCTLEDNGVFDVGPEMIAQLPPPPRVIHVELSRLNRQLLPVGQNRSILIHGGFTAGGNASE